MATRFIVGLAGGTGSGKTTVAGRIASALPDGSCEVIEYDSYYRDQTGMTESERSAVNYDHPDALESDLLASHMDQLRAGESADVPIYDFVSHTRQAEVRTVPPLPVIIVEGIMALAVPAIRERLDMRIFVDTDSDLRVFRRIRRDLEQRGRSFRSIRRQYYDSVRPMHLEFVEPSKRWADLIIPEGGQNRVAVDVLVARLERAISDG